MPQPVPGNSPKVALLDAPLPLETRLENERFVSLAASEGLVQFPFRFNETVLTPYIVPVNRQIVACA